MYEQLNERAKKGFRRHREQLRLGSDLCGDEEGRGEAHWGASGLRMACYSMIWPACGLLRLAMAGWTAQQGQRPPCNSGRQRHEGQSQAWMATERARDRALALGLSTHLRIIVVVLQNGKEADVLGQGCTG
jgi:hypothetical protein